MMITAFSSRSRADNQQPTHDQDHLLHQLCEPQTLPSFFPFQKGSELLSPLKDELGITLYLYFSVGHTDYVFSAYICLSVFYYSCVFNEQTEVGVESDLSRLLELDFVLKLTLLTKGRVSGWGQINK